MSPVSATRWRAEVEQFWRTLHMAQDIHEFDRRMRGKSLVPNRHGTLKSRMNRRLFYWKLRNSELALGERTLIMGVLNVTPDSFSDGGLFHDPDRAYARALELEEQGADIIDIGGESTRPGSSRISADEEWQRLVPVLKRLRGNLRVPISIDTYKSEIAARAMDYGVEIINDPSGLTFDPTLAKTAASANA